MDHESPASQATSAALDELFGLGYKFHDQFADRIKAVTLPEVQSIARARLNSSVVTISTPEPERIQVQKGSAHLFFLSPGRADAPGHSSTIRVGRSDKIVPDACESTWGSKIR